jgi:hydroxymethylpyrimidine pyrophosphatase-like HAD family hydrolase
VFVTGRPPRWMPPVVESTGHTGVAICANGGVLLDLATMAVLEAHGIGGASAGRHHAAHAGPRDHLRRRVGARG